MAAPVSPITVSAAVAAPAEQAWALWTSPDHITRWNHASDEWHTPRATNDLRPGGRFEFRMEARDGSVGFDFGGTYETVEPMQRLVYRLDDERRVEVAFEPSENGVHVTETFEPESVHPVEMQQAGWQAILDNYKRYAQAAGA